MALDSGRCSGQYTSGEATLPLYDAPQLRAKLILPIAMGSPVLAGRRFAPVPRFLLRKGEVGWRCDARVALLSQARFRQRPPEAPPVGAASENTCRGADSRESAAPRRVPVCVCVCLRGWCGRAALTADSALTGPVRWRPAGTGGGVDSPSASSWQASC